MRAAEGKLSNKSVNEPELAAAFGPDAKHPLATPLKTVMLIIRFIAKFTDREQSRDSMPGSQRIERALNSI